MSPPTQDAPLIRVLVVDDHRAVVEGLRALLDEQPGFLPVGVATRSEEVWPVYNTTRPDVVVLDYHLPDIGSLALCRRFKAQIPPPRVVLFSAYADAALGLTARLAGVDAMVAKGAPTRELFEAIRRVMAGERLLSPPAPEARRDAIGRLAHDERALAGMLLDEMSPRQIEAVLGSMLGWSPAEVSRRIDQVVELLGVTSQGTTSPRRIA